MHRPIAISNIKEQSQKLRSVIDKWGIHAAPDSFLELFYDDNKLKLKDKSEKKQHGICVDFLSSSSIYRKKFGGGRSQLILKAIGVNKYGNSMSVLDATPGLGKDSFIFSSYGYDVLLLERNPVVCALLDDGLNRLFQSDNPFFKKYGIISLQKGSILEQNLNNELKFDIIYLDPMYPEKRKSAKVKKEMAIFQNLIGSDDDSFLLLQSAKKIAKKRVVVKRPKTALFLNNEKPDIQYASKNTRFDVYLTG